MTAPSIPPHALGYRALKLWQRALDLAADAHRLARAFPDAEQPALAAELRRSAASVPAAIAASALALDAADQHRALQSTTAALARLETLAALAERLGALESAAASALLFTAGDVNRLLRGFVRSVAARTRPAAVSAPAGAVPAMDGAVAEGPTMGGCATDVSATAVTALEGTAVLALGERPGDAGPPPASAAARDASDAPPSMRRGRRRAATGPNPAS
jgi:four helix bundle protein